MKQRLDELTLFRAIACLSVLVVHVSAVPFAHPDLGALELEVFGYLNRAFKFTTPAFIFLSGLMQYYHQWQGNFDFKRFMKKRFGPIFWPYLAAATGYFVILAAFGEYPFTPFEYLKRLLLGDANYHLYFVVIILQFYLLMPAFLWIFERFNDHLVLVGALAVNLISREFWIFPYSDRFFLNYLFFFVLGAYVVRRMETLKKLASSSMVGLFLLYLAISGVYGYQFVTTTLEGRYWNYHLTSLTWFFFSLAALAAIYGIAVRVTDMKGSKAAAVKTWAQTISTASYWIYLIHPMVLYASSRAWRYLPESSVELELLWNSFWVFTAMLIFARIYPRLLGIWKELTS